MTKLNIMLFYQRCAKIRMKVYFDNKIPILFLVTNEIFSSAMCSCCIKLLYGNGTEKKTNSFFVFLLTFLYKAILSNKIFGISFHKTL